MLVPKETIGLPQTKGDDMPTKKIGSDNFESAWAPEPPSGKRKSSEDHNEQQGRDPVPIGTALRNQGIDEQTMAETIAYTLDALKGIVPVKDSDKKLLIEFVKECTKLLKGNAEGTVATPLPVRLIHNVARPDRRAANEGASEEKPAQSRASTGKADVCVRDKRGEVALEDEEEESKNSSPDGTLLN